MNAVRYLIALSVFSTSLAYAQECDCTSYPFRPERCFKECVKKLSSRPASEIDRVRGIDPGVSVSLQVLSQARGESFRGVDLENVRDKPSLEKAARESLKRGANQAYK